MMKRTFPVFAAVILASQHGASAPSRCRWRSPRRSGFAEAGEDQPGPEEESTTAFRGAVVMVARKGKLVYQDAIGMQTASAKMTRDSIFRIYSMTKPIVSVAAMMLVEDGTIQLTDPVSKYLPGFDKLQVSVPSKNDAGITT